MLQKPRKEYKGKNSIKYKYNDTQILHRRSSQFYLWQYLKAII